MDDAGVVISTGALRGHDLQDAAIVSARAFQNDPFYTHLSPKPILRARGMALFFRSLLANLGPGGVTMTARQHGRIVGIGAWMAPESYPAPWTNQARQAAASFRAMAVRPRALLDGTAYLLAIDKVHPKDPVWYLPLLVVDPSVQRQGIGAMLLEPTLERCDVEGIDAYLETQSEDNLAYYRRFGFNQVTELNPVRKGPPLWTLRRATRAR